MKKLFYIALSALMMLPAVSCKQKYDPTGGQTHYILALSCDPKYSLTKESTDGFLAVEVNPVGTPMAELAEFRCDPEGIISCSLTNTGVNITPLAIGKTTLTVSSKANSDIYAQCEVTVTKVPVLPKSVEVVKTDTHYSGGELSLGIGDNFQLEAKVKNVDNAYTTEYPVKWSLVSGDCVTVTEAGKVTAKSGSTSSAVVKVELKDYPDISATVKVNVKKAPTGLSISYTGAYTPNGNGEIVMKKGKTTQFVVNVQPADANPALTVSVSNSLTISASVSGNVVTVTGVSVSSTTATVTVSSPYNSGISKNVKFYVFEYDKNDVKPGDYVYTNGDGSQIRSADSGLRNLTPLVYVNPSTGNIASKPTFPGTTLPGYSNFNHIGVVVQDFLPSDNDFLGCGRFEQCRNKSNAKELYHYNVKGFRKSDLGGFTNSSSSHALVISKVIRSKSKMWQEATEDKAIAICSRKANDFYLSQLYGLLAFSDTQQADLKAYWEPDPVDPTKKVYPYADIAYVESGFVAHLLLRFFNAKQDKSDRKVLPVESIDGSPSLPKLTFEGKLGHTGWFLPGKLEWDAVQRNRIIVGNSLSQTNAGDALGGTYYWSTEETGKSEAYVYNPGLDSNYRKEVNKNTTYAVRGVFWL